MLLCPKGMVVSDLLKAVDYSSRYVLERRAKANYAMTRRKAKMLSKVGREAAHDRQRRDLLTVFAATGEKLA